MFLATITFYEPNGHTGNTLAVGKNIAEINEKIAKIRGFIENKGFRFLSSIIEELNGVTDEDTLLRDLTNKNGDTLH